MFPGTVLQAAAPRPVAPGAAGPQRPRGVAARFDAELVAAFDAGSATADVDTPPSKPVEPKTPADPRSLRERGRPLGGAAPRAPTDSGRTARARESTQLTSGDEDVVDEHPDGTESQESQAVPVALSGGVSVSTPTCVAPTTDGAPVADGDGPDEALDGQRQSPALASAPSGVVAPSTTETAGIDGEEQVLAAPPPPPDRKDPKETVAGPEARHSDEEVAESRVSGSKDLPPGGEALRAQTPSPAPATASNADVASKLTAPAPTADAVAKPAAATPTPPAATANGNALAAALAALGLARPAPSAEAGKPPVDGASVSSNDRGPDAQAGPGVPAAQETASQNASAHGGGDEAPHRDAAADVAASRGNGPALAQAMVLVQGPDGTLRLTSAALVENTALAPTPAQRAENVATLVQTMRVLVKNGMSEATVRLNPEHLGEVTIAIRVDGKLVSAVVHAESAGVREWLQSQESVLRSGLSEQGLYLDRLLVQRDARHDRREQPQPEPRRPRRRGPETPERFEVSA